MESLPLRDNQYYFSAAITRAPAFTAMVAIQKISPGTFHTEYSKALSVHSIRV
jgi:hypothetical protein